MLPEDAPPELQDSYDALLAPLLLNSALAAVRSGAPQVAISSATRALDRLQLNDADTGKQFLVSCSRPVPHVARTISESALPPSTCV